MLSDCTIHIWVIIFWIIQYDEEQQKKQDQERKKKQLDELETKWKVRRNHISYPSSLTKATFCMYKALTHCDMIMCILS